MDFHFAAAWEVVADKFPNRVATISDDKPLSWQEFERRASCLASLLEEYTVWDQIPRLVYTCTTAVNTKKPSLVFSRWAAAR